MFEKNLDALKKTHPKLAEKLEPLELSEKTTLFFGPNDDLNMAYDNIALHRMADPMGEALQVFNADIDASARDFQSNIFMFGLGLGYLLRRTFISTKGIIVVFEPYLDVLRQTLEVVDLTQEIESGRVSFITTVEEVIPSVTSIYMMGDHFPVTALPSYRELEPELFLECLNEIKSSLHLNIVGQNTALVLSEKFTRSSLENLPQILRFPEVAMLHDKFAGRPGVVVSAGPSLDRPGVLDALKAHRHNLVVACVGQAAKALDKAGIVPDFVNVLEVQDVSHQLAGVSYLDETNLLLLPQANKTIFNIPTKRKLISYTNRDPLTHWLSKAMEKPLFGYSHHGTVSITALIHLIMMGCNPIFILGQDLAYPEGQMYAQNSVYRGFKITTDAQGKKDIEWENRDEFVGIFFKNEEEFQNQKVRFLARLVETEGWNGEKLYTSIEYDSFRKAFENIRHMVNKDTTLVNCSVGGAFIKDYEHLPFVEALEKYDVKHAESNPPVEQVLQELYYEEEPGSQTFQNVYKRYQQDRQDFDTLTDLLNDGLAMIESILAEADNKDELDEGLQSKLATLSFVDREVALLAQNNSLINCYIKADMLEYSRNYGRKMNLLKEEDIVEGDMEALKENVATTRQLYQAIQKGVNGVIDTLEPVFANFPGLQEVSGPSRMVISAQTNSL